jgi:hypothetical protein
MHGLNSILRSDCWNYSLHFLFRKATEFLQAYVSCDSSYFIGSKDGRNMKKITRTHLVSCFGVCKAYFVYDMLFGDRNGVIFHVPSEYKLINLHFS